MRLSLPVISRLTALKSAFLGLFASSYLLYAYVANRPVVCGDSSGCEIVRLSKYAYVAGTIPRPLLGVLFYAAIILLVLFRVALRTRAVALWRVMQAMIVIGVIESVWLFFIQWQELKAFCLWCLFSTVAAIGLGIAAFLDRPVQDDPAERAQELRLLLVYLAILSTIFLVGLGYLLQ